MNARILKTLSAVEAFMAGRADANPLPPAAGEFVHNLLLATRAKAAVEIGTSYGYSGLWIAAALTANGGRLITIDREPQKRDLAARHIADAGLAHVVEFRTGEALELLKAVAGPIDFVLNDADKDHCREYVELLLPKLAARAVFLTDNVTTHATELAEFLGWLRSHPAFASVPLAVGNGMELSVRLG